MCVLLYNIDKFIPYKYKQMKKILNHIDKHTPHKDRLILVILFAVFAFTVILDLAIMANDALSRVY